MKNKKIWIIVIAAVLAVSAAVLFIKTSGERKDKKAAVDLYFFNEQRTSIVMETRDIKYRYSEELTQNVLKALIRGPVDSKKAKIMNSRTKVNSIQTAPEGLIVDFSGEYFSGDSAQDILTAYAVVKTLCSIDFISCVKITVDGDELSMPNGNKLGFLSSGDINLQTDTESTEMSEITLYFADAQGMYLVPQKRTIKITDKQPIEQYIVNELIKGPSDGSMSPVLSPDTSVISVETKDGICFVNLKANFLEKNSGGTAKESFAVYSIVNSLTELSNVASVQFLIDGKKTEFFGQFGFSEPFSRNEEMIHRD
ncbi:MAG: GerMN domain-containing protein [Clostridia bacterium]|nr:GerMN domain-containing protein [Clostridia bacterium]